MSATEQTQLRCDKCGTHPTALEYRYTAREGGTHYRRLVHAAGVPGREQGGKMRTCGTWIAETA